jgi:hypothetical protein
VRTAAPWPGAVVLANTTAPAPRRGCEREAEPHTCCEAADDEASPGHASLGRGVRPGPAGGAEQAGAKALSSDYDT